MKTPSKTDLSPAERVEDIPRILKALRQAVREALLRHKQAGNPVAIWHETAASCGFSRRTSLSNERRVPDVTASAGGEGLPPSVVRRLA